MLSCKKCGKDFTKMNDLKRHMARKIPCDGETLDEKVKKLVKKEVKKKIRTASVDSSSDSDDTYFDRIEALDKLPPRSSTIWRQYCNKYDVDCTKCTSVKTYRRVLERHAEKNLDVEYVVEEDDLIMKKPQRTRKAKAKAKPKKTAAAESDSSDEEKDDASDSDEIAPRKLGITSREDLKEKIHEIHNFMRNNGLGYGVAALKLFNMLYSLKKIEMNNLFEKIQLSEECRFSKLIEIEHSDALTGGVNSLQKIINKSKVKDYILAAVPSHISAKHVEHLVREISSLVEEEKSMNMSLSGKIYEYFIGRDASAISDLGAYFTNRMLVNHIYQHLEENGVFDVNDGVIPVMIDPFGGSGGFTLSYIQWMQKQGVDDWSENINNVFHFDMNADVVKYSGMEMIFLAGETPQYKKNLRCCNSFTHEFDQQYQLVVTNPPYGGDKNKKYGERAKMAVLEEHLKKLIKQLKNEPGESKRKRRLEKQLAEIRKYEKAYKKKFDETKVSLKNSSMFIRKYAKEHGLTGNDKEAVSLILIMAMLADGGTAVGVLKEGAFFNPKYAKLWKHLMTEFIVEKIVSVPQDQFENTSTKTSVVYFKRDDSVNTPRTQNVKFTKLNVVKYEETTFKEVDGRIEVEEFEDDVADVNELLISSATFEQIKEKKWNFDGKKYNVKAVTPGEGFELVKLENLSEIKTGSTPSTKNGEYWKGGTMPWVSISDFNDGIIYKTKKCLTEEGCRLMKKRLVPKNSVLLSYKLSIGKVAIAGSDMYCNEAIAYLNSIRADVSQTYLLHVLKVVDFEKYGRGTIGKNGNLNQEILKSIQIPIPTNPQDTERWVARISEPYDKMKAAQELLANVESEVSQEVKRIAEEEECVEHKLGDLCKKITNGKTNSKSVSNTGEIPFYAATASNPIGSHCKHDFDGDDYMLFAKSGGNSKSIFGNQLGIGKFWRVSGKTSANIAMIRYDFKCGKKVRNYVCEFLKNKLFTIQKSAKYSTGNGNINLDDMNQLKIPIPRDESLIEALQPKFQQIEDLKKEIAELDAQYKAEIDALRKAAFA